MRAFCVKKKNIAMFLISAPTNSQILIFKVLPIYYNSWPFFHIGSFLLLCTCLSLHTEIESFNGWSSRFTKQGRDYYTKILNETVIHWKYQMYMGDSFNYLLLSQSSIHARINESSQRQLFLKYLFLRPIWPRNFDLFLKKIKNWFPRKNDLFLFEKRSHKLSVLAPRFSDLFLQNDVMKKENTDLFFLLDFRICSYKIMTS